MAAYWDWRDKNEVIYVSRAAGTKDKIKRLQTVLAREAGVNHISQADAIDLAINEALASRKGKHGKKRGKRRSSVQ